MAKWFLGETYFEMGEYEKSDDYYNKTASIREQAGYGPSFINFNKIASARAKVMNNEKDIDLESLYSYATDIKMEWFESRTARYIGEILLNIDDQHMAAAEGWLKKAIEADKRNGMMQHLGRDHLSYAELLKRKGDMPKARENLTTAAQIFEECCADGDLKKAKDQLDSLPANT